jgi:hypothetical protein
LAAAEPFAHASAGLPFKLPLGTSSRTSLPFEETPQLLPAARIPPASPEHAAALAAALLEHLKYLDPPALRTRLSVFLDADRSLGVSGAKALLQQTLPLPPTGGVYSDAEVLGVVCCLARGSGGASAAPSHLAGNQGVDGDDPIAGAVQAAPYAQVQAAVDAAAAVVDPRVLPVFATLTLSFAAQGTQFPV